MIVSHKHKFIFLKTKKTAGTSLEIALSKLCGPDDIITPISPEDEQTRKDLGYRGPQNYQISKDKFFYNHIGCKQIVGLLGPQVWSDYYTFCFERNPWDKVISWYYWEHRQEPRPSMTEFIDSGHAAMVGGPGGFGLYTANNKVVVNKVCRFENLRAELDQLERDLNLPPIPELPRAKSKFRVDKRPYSELMTDTDKDKIAQIFQREIALFGYQF
ncbi:MAG: sulfotransferase family 2 domain-containing protein [Pseudomonadales bacterium]